MLWNVMYESECTKCNPPGTGREADEEGLEENLASLYVGEIARKCIRTLEGCRYRKRGEPYAGASS
jgi:hypothetical protein